MFFPFVHKNNLPLGEVVFINSFPERFSEFSAALGAQGNGHEPYLRTVNCSFTVAHQRDVQILETVSTWSQMSKPCLSCQLVLFGRCGAHNLHRHLEDRS